MKFTFEELHELTGASTRLSAVLSLLRDPETRRELEPEQVDHDVKAALEKFARIWNIALTRGKDER